MFFTLDLLPLNFVYFILENYKFVLESIISLAAGSMLHYIISPTLTAVKTDSFNARTKLFCVALVTRNPSGSEKLIFTSKCIFLPVP